jgi:hypothetical protein
MSLDIQYRDVTYETLRKTEFEEALRRVYPHIDWDKPFEEFKVAAERKEQ